MLCAAATMRITAPARVAAAQEPPSAKSPNSRAFSQRQEDQEETTAEVTVETEAKGAATDRHTN